MAKSKNITCSSCGLTMPRNLYAKHSLKHKKSRTGVGKQRRVKTVATDLRRMRMPGGRLPPQMLSRSIVSSVGRNPVSNAGRKYLMKALHPNDDTSNGGCLLPDESTVARAGLEYRHDNVVTAPADAVAAQGLWDCEIIVPPFSDMPMIWRTRKTGDDWAPVPTSEARRWTSVFRTNNSTMKPGLFKANSSTTTAAPVRMPDLLDKVDQFRQIYRGITVVHNASALYNQGMVTTGQWGNKPREELLPPAIGTTPYTGPNLTMYQLEDIPSEIDDVIQKCPAAGQWEARHGVYMPMRFDDPKFDWNTGVEGTWKESGEGEVNNTILTGAPVIMGRPDGVADRDAGAVWSNYLTETNYVTTAGVVNQAMGVIFFTGLDYRATLCTKVRTGVEIVPNSENLVVAAIEGEPPSDPKAVQLVTSVSARLPIAHYHKYNSLGLLLPLIGKAIAAVAPTVLPWLAGKAAGIARSILPANPISGIAGHYIEPPLD